MPNDINIWACIYPAGYDEDNYRHSIPIVNPFIGFHYTRESAEAAARAYCEQNNLSDDLDFYLNNISTIKID